ncbi:MAG TPA: VIT family protein [Chitinophagaceae bacterium]|nr:VIT family protein [Chitinophagaceae bacterium]
MINVEDYLHKHYMHKSNWLRAAVLGANDGILSVSSIAIGVAAASTTKEAIILATLAGLVAGALSMAAGEYVSVSSQTDTEHADIERETRELQHNPEQELAVLTVLFERRGLSKATAALVAKELTEKDALAVHMREELGINDITQAHPIQAALASGASFTAGAVLPLLITFLVPLAYVKYSLYGFSIIFLAVLGFIAARTGGSPVGKAMLRISIWGTLAMGASAFVGYLFGVQVQ